MILLPQKWKRQPTVPMVVDWDHPLAQDLLEFGYALPGRVPYSAVAAGSQQPFVTGAGTQDATTNGPAIAVSGTGNYIDLGRNISAPTQVASGFVRTTWHGVNTPALASSGTTGGAYVGHMLRANSLGSIAGVWGDGGGTSAANYRWARSGTGALVSGAAVSLAFACRAATDWSIYKDGASLTPEYVGSASTYNAGTGRATINFHGGITEYGQQSSSTWGYWGRALNDGEMQALHEAPFQLLVKRQRRVWVGVGAGGGASATAATAWRIRTAQQAGSAWRIRAAVQQATAWQILAAALAASVAIGWRIRTAAAAPSAWRIRTPLTAGTAWRIRQAAAAATAWRVFGAALAPTAWRIRASAAAGTAWRVLASAAQGTAWRIRAAVQQATAWQILTAALAASVAIGWRIRTAAAAPTAWRIRTALTAGTGWRVRQALAQALGWRIGALLLPAPHQVLQATRHARTLYATTHPRLLHARR